MKFSNHEMSAVKPMSGLIFNKLLITTYWATNSCCSWFHIHSSHTPSATATKVNSNVNPQCDAYIMNGNV